MLDELQDWTHGDGAGRVTLSEAATAVGRVLDDCRAARTCPNGNGPVPKPSPGRGGEARSHSYADRFEVAGRIPYVPHVTLGCFTDRPAARRARRLFSDGLDAIAHETQEERLPLSHVCLYAFTDMATFVCDRYATCERS